MGFRHERFIGLWVAVGIGACAPSRGEGLVLPVDPGNLKIPVLDLQGEGRAWIAIVEEAQAGGSDLNGDGDAEDAVFFAVDLRMGRAENLGLAASGYPLPTGGDVVAPPIPLVRDGRAVFVVSETQQGHADLNGDGDALDAVPFVYDFATGTLDTPALAVQAFGRHGVGLEGGDLLLAVEERGQGGTDLDGDGDVLDAVLHVHDLAADTTRNLELALGSGVFYPSPRGVGLFVREPLGGDLTGDGDSEDTVFHDLDLRSGLLVSSGTAASPSAAFFAAGLWAFEATEIGNGQGDLNGDGDRWDGVLHTFDPLTGAVRNLGLSPDMGQTAVGHGLFAFRIREDESGQDLNGDGDRADAVLVLHDPSTGATSNTGLAVTHLPRSVEVLDGGFAFAVGESDQGASDLNGDGDSMDAVLHLFDPLSGSISNLGLSAAEARSAGRDLLFTRNEAVEGVDLNGDGDLLDVPLFVWNGATRTVYPTGVSAAPILDVRGGLVLFNRPELLDGRDLNGDGDILDPIPALIDLADGVCTGIPRASLFGRLAEGNRVLLGVSEFNEGRDLNDDGDFEDTVLHVLDADALERTGCSDPPGGGSF